MTEHAVLDLSAVRLDSGAHRSFEQGACLLELVSYMAKEPWSDHPKCVSPVLAAFGRAWNDALDDDTRQRLKDYAPRLIGTNTGADDDETRAWMATDWLARVQTPAWLRLAGLTEQAQALESLARIVDATTAIAAQPTLDRARKDAAAAGDAARAAAWDAARAAAWAAAWDAARAAAGATAGDAAGGAAWAAAEDAAWDAAWAAAWDAARAAAGDAARAAAWAAARAAAGDAARAAARAAAWAAAEDAAWAAAWAAARAAAGKKLAPTVAALQESAFRLLDEMIAVGSAASRGTA
jgi:hypothetical protein